MQPKPNPNLPELSWAGGLARRADRGLAAVHNIQLEASATYWFERGCALKLSQEWEGARYCFTRATSLDPWLCRAWLFNALANCYLDDLDACYICIIQAYLMGVVEPVRWLVDALDKEELKLLHTKVERRFLTGEVIIYTGWLPFDWSVLTSKEEASRFVHKILAGSIIIYAIWVSKGGYYSQYDCNDNDFTGGLGSRSQVVALGDLLNRIFDCSGIASDYYSPCPAEGRLCIKYVKDAAGNSMRTDEMEMKDCSLKYLFTPQQLQLLVDVTASLLGSARKRLPRFYQRVAEAGYGSAYASFHVGEALIQEKKYDEAIAALQYAVCNEPKFNASAVYWKYLATASLHDLVLPYCTDALAYMAKQGQPLPPPAETGAALSYLEKSASLTKDDPAAWVAAGNTCLWHERNSQQAVACYQTAVAQCRVIGGREILLPKIWALYNCARAYFELDCVTQAREVYRSLALTLNCILRAYHGAESFAGKEREKYESYLVASEAAELADLLTCGQTVEFLTIHNRSMFRSDFDATEAVAA
jgi:tetratricopeptide (TPR) repeat protein